MVRPTWRAPWRAGKRGSRETLRRACAAAARPRGALGVRGTPTMFVNGAPVAGSAGFALLQRAIFEPRLAAAQALIDRGVAPADLYRTILDTADQPGLTEPPMAPLRQP
jgi:hypothetical protein